MADMILLLPERIRQLREQNGLTQSDLARKVGLTRSSINGWEMGLSTPSTANVVELAKIFHTTTDFLLGLTEQEAIVLSGLSASEKKVLYGMVECLQAHQKSV